MYSVFFTHMEDTIQIWELESGRSIRCFDDIYCPIEEHMKWNEHGLLGVSASSYVLVFKPFSANDKPIAKLGTFASWGRNTFGVNFSNTNSTVLIPGTGRTMTPAYGQTNRY